MLEKAAVIREREAGTVQSMRRKPSFWKKVGQNKTLLLMCLPAIVFFLAFSYAPLPGAYIAFTKFNYAKGIFGSPFIGFQNFTFLFQSGQLGLLLRNTVLYNIAFILLGNFLQLTFAILLNEVRSKWFKKLTQSMMFLPYFISAVLVSLLVYNLINYDYGFVSALVRSAGRQMPKYYSQAKAWPVIIVLVNLWQTTGYGTVVYFAAITGIDESMLEAARVDGANGFQRIRYILLPCLKPTVVILLLFAMGGILKGNFGLFYNLVGANSVLYKTTDIIETYVYRALMNNFNFSQGSAVGLFQSLVGFGIVLTANGIVRHIEPDYSLF
ncbi:MAG TPA: ABC transporter permease subunit [Clostridia bacterium]|nr:ABC transporter permease subunit [Clostridia bacterium]